jgi:hypothetical protein
MLAEKFILLRETLRSHTYPDGGPRVVSTSPHVPMKLLSGEAGTRARARQPRRGDGPVNGFDHP